MCHRLKLQSDLIKPLFWCLTSFEVIAFRANRKCMYDFLNGGLVINSNLGPSLHRFSDTLTYWLKIANFLFSITLRHRSGDRFRIYGNLYEF